MRLFVTGDTGFLGSHFTNLATAASHDLTAVRRPSTELRIPTRGDIKLPETPIGQLEVDDCRDHYVFLHFSAQGVSPQKTAWLDAYRYNVLEQLGALLTAAIHPGSAL